ncbi:hypothetical protein [Flavobacterium phage FpV4]|uniref:Uncharacterized protein n=2 Tax=Fipvunavirus Fpv4 TaxID=2560476 RepID=A0A1B0WKU0_9CAUD|nr:hypothetical protein BOW80_gp44 [Flavobacterium phage Fpv3]YP_009594098.1 hypothetical protein FDG89_gp42 [Flavobacterium phage FpV4]ALN97155.1 hypothetical protein [Flavobacterium phage FpV4]ANB40446.1 hypothetical protein [Flavobacterium phage Fpv3]
MTKKYKLIKEYPGSPKLGTIVDRRGVFVYFDINSPNVNMTVSQNYVENYPEYWEEVIEKNYEILSFVCNQNFNELRKGEIITKQENGQYKGDKILTWKGEEGLVKMKHWSIYSVKRLSDGELFTLGNRVQDSLTDELTNFKVQNITFFYPGIKIICQAESGTTMPLNTIRHINNYLFTTKDGEEIYEGNEYFRVFKKDFELYNHQTFANKQYNFEHMSESAWHFSTKEAAQEFILSNKPCLSVIDVMNAGYGICNSHALLSIVNSKINGKAKD